VLSIENKQVLELQSQCILRDLSHQLGMTIGLAVLDANPGEVSVIACCQGQGVSVHLQRDFCCSIHVAAPGKAIVAYLGPDRQERILNLLTYKQHTENTITDKTTFARELHQTARNGYAVDHGEGFAGVNCVAVPVFDRQNNVIAGLWATGFSSQLDEDDFAGASKVLAKGANALRQILVGDQQANSYAKSIVDICRKFMDEHFRESIDIQNLAACNKVKYAWFRSHFKAIVGIPPKQYILQLKMNEAQKLLRNTQLPVGEIAGSLGYESQNYFSAAFRRRFGYYPTDARN
jgi:DNA-binding IclR family transcriptional regulator/AraC-like DNA-binding protein